MRDQIITYLQYFGRLGVLSETDEVKQMLKNNEIVDAAFGVGNSFICIKKDNIYYHESMDVYFDVHYNDLWSANEYRINTDNPDNALGLLIYKTLFNMRRNFDPHTMDLMLVTLPLTALHRNEMIVPIDPPFPIIALHEKCNVIFYHEDHSGINHIILDYVQGAIITISFTSYKTTPVQVMEAVDELLFDGSIEPGTFGTVDLDAAVQSLEEGEKVNVKVEHGENSKEE